MIPFHKTASAATFIVAVFSCLCAQYSSGQENSFRMPQYADSQPPAPRTREEVAKLLAGADKNGAKSEEAAAPLRVVLVAGPKDHKKGEHDYLAWLKVWSRLLAEAPKTTVDTAWEFPSAKQFEAADTIVFYQRG